MVLIFLVGGLDDGGHADQAGIEPFSYALDCASFSRRVRALEDDDERALGFAELALPFQQFDLLIFELWLVFIFLDRLVIEVFEVFTLLQSNGFDEVGRHAWRVAGAWNESKRDAVIEQSHTGSAGRCPEHRRRSPARRAIGRSGFER